MVAVGQANYPPTAFYYSEPREVKLAIDGHRQREEDTFRLNQIAMSNSIGIFFGGKKFKVTNPFDKSRSGKKSKVGYISPEDKDRQIEYFRKRFE